MVNSFRSPHFELYSCFRLYIRCSWLVTWPKMVACIKAPTIMITMEKIFSYLVLAATLPKPTVVREVQVKYRAVM